MTVGEFGITREEKYQKKCKKNKTHYKTKKCLDKLIQVFHDQGIAVM